MVAIISMWVRLGNGCGHTNKKCQEEQPSPFIKCVNGVTERVSHFKVKLREEKSTELKGWKSMKRT